MKIGDLVLRKVQGVQSHVFGLGIVVGRNPLAGYVGVPEMYQVMWSGTPRFPGRFTKYTPVEHLISVEERVA